MFTPPEASAPPNAFSSRAPQHLYHSANFQAGGRTFIDVSKKFWRKENSPKSLMQPRKLSTHCHLLKKVCKVLPVKTQIQTLLLLNGNLKDTWSCGYSLIVCLGIKLATQHRKTKISSSWRKDVQKVTWNCLTTRQHFSNYRGTRETIDPGKKSEPSEKRWIMSNPTVSFKLSGRWLCLMKRRTSIRNPTQPQS